MHLKNYADNILIKQYLFPEFTSFLIMEPLKEAQDILFGDYLARCNKWLQKGMEL